MATSGVINGTDLRIYVGGTPIGYATSCTLDLSAETRDTIHKDATGNGWAESAVGQLSGSVSFEGFVNEDSSNVKPDALFTYFKDKTLVGCAFKTATSGDTRYDFSGYVTSLSQTGPVEENSTFSGSITISGAVTTTTVT
jgi:predicted secreted protein